MIRYPVVLKIGAYKLRLFNCSNYLTKKQRVGGPFFFTTNRHNLKILLTFSQKSLLIIQRKKKPTKA